MSVKDFPIEFLSFKLVNDKIVVTTFDNLIKSTRDNEWYYIMSPSILNPDLVSILWGLSHAIYVSAFQSILASSQPLSTPSLSISRDFIKNNPMFNDTLKNLTNFKVTCKSCGEVRGLSNDLSSSCDVAYCSNNPTICDLLSSLMGRDTQVTSVSVPQLEKQGVKVRKMSLFNALEELFSGGSTVVYADVNLILGLDTGTLPYVDEYLNFVDGTVSEFNRMFKSNSTF